MNKLKVLLTIILVTVIINALFLSGFLVFKQSEAYNNKKNNNLENIKNIDNTNKTEKSQNIHNIQNKITKAISENKSSIVSIVATKKLKYYYNNPNNFFEGEIRQKQEKIGGGSGIIIGKKGYILTNKHVVQNPRANYSIVRKNGKRYKVDKIWHDPVLDIAVLKVKGKNGKEVNNLEPIQINELKDTPKIGEFVVAIGNALTRFEDTATFGILSGKGRELDNLKRRNSIYVGLYQTDAPINPGNSGGPLINISGEVIGINTAISAVGQGIGFSIPINKEFVKSTLNMVKNNGKIKRPFVGIKYLNIDKGIQQKYNLSKSNGILVQSSIKGSPAYNVGIREGDIITKINGIKINKDNPLLYLLFSYKPGEEITITYFSGNKKKKTNIKLSSRN